MKLNRTVEQQRDKYIADLQKELDSLLAKRDRINEKIMMRFHDGSATRARTTTGNADADRVNDCIVEIRALLRSNYREITKCQN